MSRVASGSFFASLEEPRSRAAASNPGRSTPSSQADGNTGSLYSDAIHVRPGVALPGAAHLPGGEAVGADAAAAAAQLPAYGLAWRRLGEALELLGRSQEAERFAAAAATVSGDRKERARELFERLWGSPVPAV